MRQPAGELSTETPEFCFSSPAVSLVATCLLHIINYQSIMPSYQFEYLGMGPALALLTSMRSGSRDTIQSDSRLNSPSEAGRVQTR